MKTFRPICAALLLLAVAVSLAAQSFSRWTYTAGYQVTGTANKTTLQLPANAGRRARPLAISLTCETNACEYTVLFGGTAASATLGTIGKGRSSAPSTAAEFYTASNQTGGTALPGPEPIPFAGKTVLDMGDIELLPGERVTISLTSGSSQKLTVNWKWEEYY